MLISWDNLNLAILYKKNIFVSTKTACVIYSAPTALKILYIEDDHDDRMFLSESFAASQTNAEMVYASNGKEAIRFLTSINEPSHYPHLIILDLNMPRYDGRQTLTYIKSSPQLAKIPIAVFSTSDTITDIESCRVLGATTYIQKPFHYHGYKDVVQKFISLLPETGLKMNQRQSLY